MTAFRKRWQAPGIAAAPKAPMPRLARVMIIHMHLIVRRLWNGRRMRSFRLIPQTRPRICVGFIGGVNNRWRRRRRWSWRHLEATPSPP